MNLLESKRLLSKRNIGLFLVIASISLYFVQIGINNYKNIIENKSKFLDIEKLKVEQYINYAQYGTYGFRILFIPSPLSVYFFNSCTISELTSNVDSGERLNIYNSFKGKTLFTEKSGGFKDFSGIMLLLGSLLALYIGYQSLIYRDYFRFMALFAGYKKIFFSCLLNRVALFLLFFLFNALLTLVLFELNGIHLSNHEYLRLAAFFVVMFLMLLFFFALGTMTGTFRSRFFGLVMVMISWFVFVFLVPGVVSTITSNQADNIASNYQLELEKLKTLMSFEQKALKQRSARDLTRGKSETDLKRDLIESYWDNEVKEIQAFEKRMGKEIEENIRRFQTLSFLFPSTFYLAANNEISSKGYGNFIEFFDYIRELKEKFIRFFINKKYYSNFSKVESFLKGEENLFYAKSELPGCFFLGVILTVIYIIIIFLISFFRFKKSLQMLKI